MSAGRPREFDADKALDKALRVFWRQGFEGTSMPDLTKAMGINRPSLYAAFGNKEALFRKAIDRYSDGPASYFHKALEAPDARVAVEKLLHGTIQMLTDPRNPPGCFMVQSVLACGKAADALRQELIARRMAGETAIRQRLERAVVEGGLPARIDCAGLARDFATVMHGMAVQAASGLGRADLRRIAATAMLIWP